MRKEPGFGPRPIDVRFVVDQVALGEVLSENCSSPLSVLFRQCPIGILILRLLLPEAGEAWEPSNISGDTGRFRTYLPNVVKSLLYFFCTTSKQSTALPNALPCFHNCITVTSGQCPWHCGASKLSCSLPNVSGMSHCPALPFIFSRMQSSAASSR